MFHCLLLAAFSGFNLHPYAVPTGLGSPWRFLSFSDARQSPLLLGLKRHPMTAKPPENTNSRTQTLVIVVGGISAVVALMAAMVWVVQGHVQQAEVLRAQWQSQPRGFTKPNRIETERASDVAVIRNGGVIVEASFDRP